MMYRRLAAALSVTALVSLGLNFWGCGGKEEPRREQGEEAVASVENKGEPRQGGVLVIGSEADADALNPIAATTVTASDVYGHIFIYLCRINPDMETYRPWGAKSWEFSEDRKTLTFHLRDDIYWHDGVKMTAYDVEWSFYLYKNPEAAWSAIRWLDDIESMTAVDSFTVVVKYSRVYPYQLTDANVFHPLPKHLLKDIPPLEMKNAGFNRHPIGNGPFKFSKWIPQQQIEIVANEDYFLGRPNLDKVVWKIIPDRTNLLMQIEKGEIDLYHNFPPRAYERLSKNSNLKIYRYPSRAYTYIGWNTKDPLFASRNVRRALNMAINRKEIIDALYYGLGRPAPGPFLSWLWAYNPNIKQLPYDPVKAKEVLAEEGWEDRDGDGWLDKDGSKFEFELKTNENNDIRKDITVIVQNKLKELGIKVNPRYVEWTMFVKQMQERDFQAAVAGWNVGIKADLTTIWHSKSINDKFNYVSYSNPRVDELIDRAKVEMDREKAKALWGEAQQLIVDDAPYCFLFNLDELNALNKKFKNVQMITYGWDYNLEEWYIEE